MAENHRKAPDGAKNRSMNPERRDVRGQPAKIMDDRIFEQLVQLITAGNYVQVACSAVGISTPTYYRSMGYGRTMEEMIENEFDDAEEILQLIDDGDLHAASNRLGYLDDGRTPRFSVQDCRFVQFRRAVAKGSALSEATAVLEIRKAMPNNWKAAVEFLERRFPQRWRKRIEMVDGEAMEDEGIDEQLLLSDPKAVSLIHEALDQVARLPAGERPVDATADLIIEPAPRPFDTNDQA